MTDVLSVVRAKLAELGEDNSNVDEVLAALRYLEALANEQAAAIPKHTQKQVEELLAPLRERAKKLKTKKIGFSFKSLPASSTAPVAVEAASSAPVERVETTTKAAEDVPLFLTQASTLAGKDVVYQDLEDKVILIQAPIKALTLSNLKRCRVYSLSSIESSMVVRSCDSCEIHARANQIRIHSCTGCQFNVFCATDPIIEKSTGLEFRECRVVPGEENAKLHPEWTKSDANRFKNIRDFNWLKPQASPNFTIGPSETREPLVAYDQTIQFY